MKLAQPLFLKILLAVSLFAWLSFHLYQMKSVVPFHEDEHVYMNRTIFFDLYLQKNFTDPIWFRFENDYSKLPDLLYGAALTLHTGTSTQTYLSRVKFNEDLIDRRSWNVRYSQEYKPLSQLPKEIYERVEPVRVARWVSWGLTIGSLVCVMAIGWVLGDWLAGVLAAGMLGFHPLFVYVMLTAMGDAPLIFFSSLTLLLSLVWLRALRSGQYHFGWAMVLGITVGLAVSSKLNGVFSAVSVIGLFCLATFWSQEKKKMREAGLAFLIMSMTCVNTLLLLTPQIWSHPISGFMDMIHQRNEIARNQQEWFSSDALLTFTDRLEIALLWLFSWHDGYGDFPVQWEQVGLFLAGILTLGSKLKHILDKKSLSLHAQLLIAFLLWVSCVGGLTLVSIPLNWNRYYLPMVLIVIMIQATGASFLAQFSIEQLQNLGQRK